MSSIKDHIQEDMKQAMRAQEKEKLSVIRLILAAIKQREVDERITVTDEQTLAILEKMIKQRRESIQQFEAGNRPELAQKEAAEITIIETYLPARLSDTEVDTIIQETLQETAATSARDMGKVMAALKAKLQGRAEMTVVSAKVKQRLAAL